MEQCAGKAERRRRWIFPSPFGREGLGRGSYKTYKPSPQPSPKGRGRRTPNIFYRRRLSIRSTEACPPPAIKSASALPRQASASCIPAGPKKAGQSSLIAVTITQVIRKAPTRVNNPSSTRTPPTNSATAAAANHNQVGRMNGNGANCDRDVHLAQPGPLNVPKTFCAPFPIKIAPSVRRSGTVAQVEEVKVSLRSMTVTFRFGLLGTSTTINPFRAVA